MISENELDRQCNPRTLQRARSIAASDRNILTKQVRYDDDETILSAFVASSSGWDDRYRTSVSFDETEDLITDYVCTCPAYSQYDGMCKHCGALVLAYNDAPQTFLGYKAEREAITSTCIAEFMQRAEQISNEDDLFGSIDIETTIAYGYRTWSANFRIIGPQGSYVMKSISEFVDRMRSGERFSYGKKLAFTHIPTLLTDHAREVAQFLDRAVSLRERATGSAFWRYRGKDEVGRDIDLSDAEVIELLDLQAGRTFSVQGTDYGTRSVTHAHIVDADPHIDINLRASERGGYLIVRSDDIVLAAQGERMYVWQDDVFYRCSPVFAQCSDFLRNVYDSEDNRLFIAEADMPLFCATALPAIEEHLHVNTPEEVKAYRPIPCKLEFYFDKTDEGILCNGQAVYETHYYPLWDTTPPSPSLENKNIPGPLRNERLEEKGVALIERYFGSVEPLIPIANDEAVANLLFGGLAGFRALGTVFTTPAFDRLIRDDKPHVTLGVSLVGNLINLTVSTNDLPSRELSALLSSYRAHKRYHRLRSGAFLDMEDYDLSQLDRLAADLGLTAKQLASGSAEIPAYRAFYLDEEADLDRDRSFTRYVENFRTTNEHDYEAPASLANTLRPYQIEGFRWLAARCDAGFGGILADEMGLGKSIQLISLLLARREEASTTGPSLIVCPASLVYNWMAELERFAPELKACAVVGTKHERQRSRKQAFGPRHLACDVLVTSYDLLRIDVADYAELPFFCCALDEAQCIKNPATLTTRSVKRVQALHRFALTGTPMENRLSELWSIFDFLMPGLLGPYTRFRERFELSIVGGDRDVAHRLQALVGPFMLRRLKTDVLRDLPDKLESIVYAPMEGEQLRLYTAHEQRLREELTEQKNTKDFNKRKVETLAELTKLRQLCCDPHLLYENYTGHAAKLDTIMELVESAMDAGSKTLVFSQFTSFLALIADKLDKHGISYFTITGATPKKQRLELVNEFNADDTPVFLVSLKAGGTGLNLTGASVVVHADPWWNAAAQNQATDRAHRIGQTQVVSVHRVIAKGTIEERIVHLQEAKSELADQIIGASGISLSSLSKNDLIDLLQA